MKSNGSTSKKLVTLINNLPEIYQPIFAHPELTQKVSRSSNDRWKTIKKIYTATSKKLGRPLHVLDLGCSQGFFSLNLAKAGAIVKGIDYLEKNIAVCKAIADEYPDYKVQFEVIKIEDFLPSIQQDQYDLVLGLSVFHHLIYGYDKETVTRWLVDLGKKIKCAIIELALKSEPVYWADTLPDRPQEILSGFAFIYEVNRYATHLSEIKRPLYFASNFIWYLDGKTDYFKTWKYTSHQLVGNNFQGSRQYFIGEKYITKLFSLDTDPHLVIANKKEIQEEANFLRNPPSGFQSPHLVTDGVSDTQTWLVRELLPGQILSELIVEKREYTAIRIIGDVLDQLCVLETNNLFHNDLRTWNVLVTSDGRAVLIDYGDISSKKQDVVWPHNLFLSFWIFVHEAATGILETPFPQRQPFISPFNLPAPYQLWAMAVWNYPPEEWSFKLVRKEFQKMKNNKGKRPSKRRHTASALDDSGMLWMRTIEEYVDTLNLSSRSLQQDLQNNVNAIRAEMNEIRVDYQMQTELYAVAAEHVAIRTERERLHEELRSIYSSTSWRITAPVRYTKTVLITIIHIPWRAMKRILAGLVRFMDARPDIKGKLVRLLAYFPMIDRIARRVMNEPIESHASALTMVGESPNISLKAQQIHKDLLDAIEQNKTGR